MIFNNKMGDRMVLFKVNHSRKCSEPKVFFLFQTSLRVFYDKYLILSLLKTGVISCDVGHCLTVYSARGGGLDPGCGHVELVWEG